MFSKTKLTKLSAAIGLGTVALSCNLAQAQTLEEVVVTAQKRSQSLQDVGISVSALSSEKMNEYGFSNASDIITKVPSLDNNSPYGPGSSANITVRGIGLNDFGEGHEAPVTAYVDEFYLVATPVVDFALYDLERVEVLRGPQGTLFGRNSTGGLVHYVTAKPTEELSGFLSLTAARFGEIKGEGAISGSLTDTLSGRLSFLSHESDGYIKNLNPNFADGGQAGTKAFRGQLKFSPSDDLNILLKAEYADISKNHLYYEHAPMVTDPVTGLSSTASSGTDIAGYNSSNFGAGRPNVSFTDTPQKMEQDGSHLLLRIDKEFDDFTFTSVTGYLEMERELTEDCDASPNNICSAVFPYESDWYAQEFKLTGSTDGMRWTAGLYYLNQSAENKPSAVFNVPFDPPTTVDPVTGLYNGFLFPIALSADWEQDTESYSVFGQLEYDLSEQFTVTAGLRVGHDEKDFTDTDNATLRDCPGFPIPSNCFLPPNGPGIANPYSFNYEEDLVSWKLGLDYRTAGDQLIYISISQGTKSGGLNNGFYSDAARANRDLIPYEDEKNIAYEIGLKSEWWDRRVRFNAAAFYYDYSDYQTFNFDGLGGLVGNNDAEASGFEVEVEAFVTDSLYMQLGLSYLDTNIEDVQGPAAGYIADREMSNAPEKTANGSITYELAPFNGIETKLIWDWNYVSERYINNFNDPTGEIESYFKHNASIVFNWDDHWTLTAFVRNIGDRINESKVFVFGDLGYRQETYSQPRTTGVTLRYSF